MSFSRYPTYKDSGVEWLGDVPGHWHHVRVKNIFVIGRGRVISLEAANEDGTYPVFSSQTTNDGCLGYIETFDFDCDQLTWTTDGANAGTVFLRRGKHNCTNVCGTLQVKNDADFNLSFGLHYLTFATQFYKRPDTNGAKIMNGEMAEVAILVPPLPEQTQIAAFLDRETAKIDALVAEQRRLMELLKEKRQAVISHAVTQGLNPHAPMKPSGIEWLGDVPKHWEVTRFKRIAELIDGDRSSAYPSDQDIVDEGIPFLSSKNIVGYKFFNTGLRFITQEKFDALSRGKILDNDLAITVRGTIGHVAIYDAKLLGHPTAFINAQMMIMRPIGVTSSFVHSISESHYWQKQLDVASYGTAQQQLSNAILQNIFVVLPPAKERDEISIFLVTELAKFDTLTTEAQRAIDLLQERRTALISAAVTGQIDVRGT